MRSHGADPFGRGLLLGLAVLAFVGFLAQLVMDRGLSALVFLAACGMFLGVRRL